MFQNARETARSLFTGRSRVLVLGVVLLGACGEGLRAPEPTSPAPPTSATARTAATAVLAPAGNDERGVVAVPAIDEVDRLLAEVEQLLSDLDDSLAQTDDIEGGFNP